MRILLFAVVAALSACAQPRPDPPCCAVPDPAVQETVASLWTADTRTILAGDAANRLAHQCSRVSPGPVESVWTPSATQIEALEDGLILLLAQRLEAAGQSPSPGDYYRQYAGFVIGGRQVIYVNGVAASAVERGASPAPAFDWRTQAISICDGGTITFGAEYDAATGQFSNFEFNGSLG